MTERERLERKKLEKAEAEKKSGRIRIGMLTGGDDYQVLNAMVHNTAKALYNLYDGVDIIGFRDGYRGPVYEDYHLPLKSNFSGILTQSDTLLGASRQPFKQTTRPDENSNNKVKLMGATYHKLRLDCPYVLGGNDSQKTTNLLRQERLNITSLSKTTSDNLSGADETPNFQSAAEVASGATDCIHTTTAPHDRVPIVKAVGRKVGWLTLYADITGDMDIVLIPEIPCGIEAIIEALQKHQWVGSHSSIVAAAKGAILKEMAAFGKKERRTKFALRRYPSVAYEIGTEIQAITGQEVHMTVPGHTQRGSTPNPCNRVLSSRFGAHATKPTNKGRFNEMMVIRNNEITSTPFEEPAGKLKTVDLNSSTVERARLLGLSFGDR